MTTDLGPILLIGAGGLVGRHLEAAAHSGGLDVRTVAVPWSDRRGSVRALTQAIDALVADDMDHWTVVWAAGAGVVATPEADLAAEVEVFTEVVEHLTRVAASGTGAVVLMSSAGGVHAGSVNPPFTEETAPAPLVAYGRAKLAMEDALREQCPPVGLRSLVLRLANVYGPGQRLNKAQGLVSQISLAHATGAPLPVLVAQDTMRDYVYAADLGLLTVVAIRRLHDQPAGAVVLKIVAAGAPTSVGELIGQARRVLRRPLRTAPVSGRVVGQVPELRFRSLVWTDLDSLLATPLPVGLSQTAQDVLERVARHGRDGDLDGDLARVPSA